jgi:serine/threonine-protein kinase
MYQQLGIVLSGQETASVTLPLTNAEPTGVYTVTPGQATVRTMDNMGKLKRGSLLSGRFLVGEGRLYGRFTEARMKNDTTVYPVCFELTEDGRYSVRGVKLEPGSTPEAPRIFSNMGVRGVKRFE